MLSTELEVEQKRHLHELIRNYVQKNILPFLKYEDKKKLSVSFVSFINSKNYVEFDNYYIKLKLKLKLKLFLTKFISFSSIRRTMRKKTKEEIKLNIY